MVWENTSEGLELDILNRLNTKSGGDEIIREVLGFFSSRLAIEAVGIRLFEGDDYPYFSTTGFPDTFVEMENFLCVRDANGYTVLGANGLPLLECMCGNVISGAFDASLPFFTRRGSFWTNNTSTLLATTTEDDRQGRTRNTCNGCGYQSVALIPIIVNDERIGLLQLNDHETGKFNLALIETLERICEGIGVALVRCKNEERIRREIRLKAVIEMAGSACHEMNQPLQVLLGTCELITCGIIHAKGDRFDSALADVQKSARDIGRLTRKMQNITRYCQKPYAGSDTIVDIDRSCGIS